MSYQLKDYLNSINYTKEKLMDSEDEMWEKKYPMFIVHRILSGFEDCIFLINEMNCRNHIDNKLKYDFLQNSIRKRKRFSQMVKSDKIKDIDSVKEYYGYSNDKAKEALKILRPEQIQKIKENLKTGGMKK